MAISEDDQFANGLSVWTEILLSKYLFSRATHNLCRDYNDRGLPISTGTITDGLKRMAPLFEPLIEEFVKKQLTEDLFHNDETGWKVFEGIEGKAGYRWYLWVTQSKSVIYYIMAPTRSGDIPIEYFSGLDKTLDLTDQSSDFAQQHQRLEETLAQMKTRCDDELKKQTLHLAQRKVLESLNNHWLGLRLSRLTREALDWYKADGGLKDMSCRVAMLRMAEDDLITLPPPRCKPPSQKVLITSKSDPQTPITEPVHKKSCLEDFVTCGTPIAR